MIIFGPNVHHIPILIGFPGRPEVATALPLIDTGFTLPDIEVVKSVTLLLHLFQAYSHFKVFGSTKCTFSVPLLIHYGTSAHVELHEKV